MKETTLIIDGQSYKITILTLYDGNYQYRVRLNGEIKAQEYGFKCAKSARVAGVQVALEHWRKVLAR